MLLFQTLAQADSTGERIQMIIIGLMAVAAGLALLTAWYWRVTDPRRRAEPQPTVEPAESDRFVPVESPVEPVPLDDEADGSGGSGGQGSGMAYELAETGDVTIRRQTAETRVAPDDPRGGMAEPEASGEAVEQTVDLRESAQPQLEPLPERPDGQTRRIGLPEPTEPLDLDLREPAPAAVAVEELIDLTTPAQSTRAGVSETTGLSVDEWLALDGEEK